MSTEHTTGFNNGDLTAVEEWDSRVAVSTLASGSRGRE